MLPAQSGKEMLLAGWIMLAFWWVYLIMFKSLYTALMTSKMSVSYQIAPVTGLEQLASRSDLVPIVMRDSVLKGWLEVTHSVIFYLGRTKYNALSIHLFSQRRRNRNSQCTATYGAN